MVRIATIKDFERINELRKQVNDLHVKGRPDHFKAGWNEELQHHAKVCIESENNDILVVERNGIICGFACVDYIDVPESPYRFARHFYHVRVWCGQSISPPRCGNRTGGFYESPCKRERV